MSYVELNLTLTEEQKALKSEILKFSIEVLRPASIILDKMNPEDVIKTDSPYWNCMKKMYELKYHTLAIPEKYGGIGLDPLTSHIFWESLAYGSIGFAISLGCAGFVANNAAMFKRKELIKNFIEPFVECNDAHIMSSWAITEPDHGSDNMMPNTEYFRDNKIVQQMKAKKNDEVWILNGQKSAWVSNGPIASNCLLFLNIKPEKGISGGGICFAQLDQHGIERGKPIDKLGQKELPQGELFFNDVELSKEFMIFGPESYEMMTEVTLAHANAIMGACFTGLAQAAYDLALKYSTERVQGGKLLCRHQLVQKKLFDMFVKIETARAYSRTAMIYNKSIGLSDAKYSIASKVYCTQVAFEVTNEAIQIFGGYGLSREFLIEKLFRDARSGLIEDGSNDTLAITAGNMLINDALNN